jgi:hypothetical protein
MGGGQPPQPEGVPSEQMGQPQQINPF